MNSIFDFSSLASEDAGTDAVINGTRGDDTIKGTDGDDSIYGSTGNDNLQGGQGDDHVQGGGGVDFVGGGQGNDTLLGGAGDDTLHGGIGADSLVGGQGGDVFSFTALSDSTVDPAGRDTVIFSSHQGDSIDLSAIDADTTTDGDQAFHLVKQFNGHAGELTKVATQGGFMVEGDVNGDGQADFAIFVHSTTGLHSGDFVL